MIKFLQQMALLRKSRGDRLRIALLSDSLTHSSLARECEVLTITPSNYKWQFKYGRPDMLLVESAWQGYANKWKFRIAAYPDHPKRNNQALVELVARARDCGIPTVFWNKEDGVHFDRFIDSARLFDHIFTVDENCIPRYRAIVEPNVTVNTLMFAVQPASHCFDGFNFKHHRANFVGSYSRHIHDHRRRWQDDVFGAAVSNGLGLTVVDRNSDRKSAHYRFPAWDDLRVLPAVSHSRTSQIYKDYLVSINVNTVVDSQTMFSRRLVEILACGGIAVTNPTPAVEQHFKDYCHVIANAEEASELFARLRHGPTGEDLARAEAGARFVLAQHTWSHRLQEIAETVGLS